MIADVFRSSLNALRMTVVLPRIAQAAVAARSAPVTHITVIGHTDTVER